MVACFALRENTPGELKIGPGRVQNLLPASLAGHEACFPPILPASCRPFALCPRRPFLRNAERGLLFPRITSDLIPLASHPANRFPWDRAFAPDFARIGDLIRSAGMHISMHPVQYTLLNSPRPEGVEAELRRPGLPRPRPGPAGESQSVGQLRAVVLQVWKKRNPGRRDGNR